MQAYNLFHYQEQEDVKEPFGAEEALQVLQEARRSQRDKITHKPRSDTFLGGVYS